MTTDDLHNPAAVRAAARRVAQRVLSIAHVPDTDLDRVAQNLMDATGGQAAMVNFIGHDVQTFAGLATRDPRPGERPFHDRIDRTMDPESGFCIYTTERATGLIHNDVLGPHQYVGNDAIDGLGVRAYGGMQIRASAISANLPDAPGQVPLVLGTVCVVSADPRSTQAGTAWDEARVGELRTARDQVEAILRGRLAIDELVESVAAPAMVTTAAGAVLYLNTAWEEMFGRLQDLGVPAAKAFPALTQLGAVDALEQLRATGQPRAAAVGELSLAVVPATVPGQSAAALTLIHPTGSNPIAAAQAAVRLADAIAALPRTA